MSKYVILPSTITKTSLRLAKYAATAGIPSPVVFTKHYTVVPGAPHISKIIYTLKKGAHPASMLPYLIGRTIVYRGNGTGKGATITKTSSSGLIHLFYYSPYYHYVGTSATVKYKPTTIVVSLSSFIKYLSNGLYTLI